MIRRSLCVGIALTSVMLSGCCCDRPFFWRWGCGGGGCGEAAYRPLFPNLPHPFLYRGPAPMSMPATVATPMYGEPGCATCGTAGYPTPYAGQAPVFSGQPVFTGPPSTALPAPSVEKQPTPMPK